MAAACERRFSLADVNRRAREIVDRRRRRVERLRAAATTTVAAAATNLVEIFERALSFSHSNFAQTTPIIVGDDARRLLKTVMRAASTTTMPPLS